MTDTAAAPKTKLVAGLLEVFLGGFGAHKFYLSDNKAGVIRIVASFVFGIGVIWGFIEGVMLLVKGGTDVNGVELV